MKYKGMAKKRRRGSMPLRREVNGLRKRSVTREEVEEALRQTEEKYRSIFENAAIGIYQSTPDGRFLDVNPSLARMFGYPSPEELVENVIDISRQLYVDPNRREEFKRLLTERDTVKGFEVESYRKDGSKFWVSLSARVLRDLSGHLLCFEGAVEDITERKRGEEALESRAREMAALYQTTRDLATAQDLPTLLQTIVERAAALLEASCGSIFLYDADRQDLEIVVTAGPELPVGTHFALGEGMAGRVAQTYTPLIVDDYRTWEHRSPQIGEIPFSASIEVPMLYGGELIGILAVNEVGETTRKFTEEDVRLLSLFASQAASAVYNGHLFDQAQRRLRETLLLNRVIAAASSALEPNAVLTTICQELAHALKLPQAGIALFNADRTLLTVVAEYREEGRPPSLGATIPVIGNLATQFAIEHRMPVVVPNAQTDERQSVIHELEKQLDVASLLIVPLVSRNQVIGTLGLVAGESRDFSPDEIALAQHLTAAAGQAFENAQLYAAVQQELAERKRYEFIVNTSDELMSLINRERQYEGVNSAYALAHRKTRGEIIGRTVAQVWGEGRYQTTIKPHLDRCFAGEIERYQAWFEFDGTDRRYFDVTYYPYSDPDGTVARVVVVSHDITKLKQAEEALRESEERFYSAFEYANIGMALVAPDGRWLKVNRSVCELTGYAESELLSKTFQDITHPDDLEASLSYVRQMLAGAIGSYQMEKRYFHKQGRVVWVLLSVSLVWDNQGKPLYFISQIQDITQRKRTEETLEKERNILRTLIDNVPDYMYVKDAESRFVVGNLAIAHSLGKTKPEEIYGQSDFDFHAPELAAQFFADEQAIVRTGQPLINREEFVFEPTGNQRWLITTKMPLRDSRGKIVGLVGVGRDITERRRTEQALQRSEKKYRQLVETLQEGIWVIDRDAYTNFVNPRMAEMLGYSVDEMLGQHLFSFMDEPGVEISKRYLERRQQGIRERHDFEFLRKDGSRIFTSLEAAPIIEESGEYAGAIAGVTDLTERKQSEEAVKASEQYARNIIDSSLDMIISVDRERRIVEFNHAAETAFGYTRDEVLGKNISLLYADSAEGQTVHQTTFEKGNLVREVLNRRKNGEAFPSLLSASVMRDGGGDLIGVVGVSRDITEPRRAEEALRRRLAELGALHMVSAASAEASDEDALIGRATQVIGQNLFPDNFGLLLLDQAHHSLHLHRSYHADATIKNVIIPFNQGITGQVAATGKPIRCGDALKERAYLQLDPRIRSELCVPLKVGDRILGVINAESTRPNAFTEADERLMVTLASQLASAIDRLRAQVELQRLATMDELTCVFNRRYFFELARREFDRSQRLGHPLSAIMLDIDHFKAVNDTYGHAIGDEVLRAVVADCLKHIREIDFLGRYGGEEFTILLVESDLSNALQVAERLRVFIAGHEIPTARGPVPVTVSLGVAQLKQDTKDITTLIACADAAMYMAKAAGRNRVAVA